jgi:hypothetical protein
MKGSFNPMFKKPVVVYGIINIRVLPQVEKWGVPLTLDIFGCLTVAEPDAAKSRCA